MSGFEDFDLAFWHGRAFMYRLANVVFSGEPDESLLSVLSSSDCVNTLREMSEICSEIEPLVRCCEALDPGDLAGISSAYNRAVMGLGKRVSHPWESSYTSPRRLLLQEETLAVRNAYREFGYLPKLYPHVADDHISLECAFMAALAERSLKAIEVGDAEALGRLVSGQRRFLEEHLLKWVGRYAEDLGIDVPGSPYAASARALASFILADDEFLKENDV